MVIDFGKLGQGNFDTLLQPREIFSALPKKKVGKFPYPRDVQSQVWEHWYAKRSETDLVIKMNTGSGKTVVGLMILKSCLNEGKGPAAYIVPDNYLLQQVQLEASDLGLEITSDVHSHRFISGKAILVANVHKLINGLSVFGVGDQGVKIRIGSLLIDDAHACLDTIEDQFTISIPCNSDLYTSLFELFSESLSQSCDSKYQEILFGDPSSYMQVPFWSWQNSIKDITRKLITNKNDDQIKFNFPLLKESLNLCRAVVSAHSFEITPNCVPIHMIPSVTSASRRIFMSATLADDGILATHFGITNSSISEPIIPASAGDIGDRLILLPQVINPEISDKDVADLCKFASEQNNVVVIVPSEHRAKFWTPYADLVLNKGNVESGIERLKKEKVGLVILVNRYDGIDLPDAACRLLVIDGLPDVRKLIDKVNQGVLMGSDKLESQIIQKIEQGMGRGIRSNDDYCVVLLMGKNLTSQLYSDGAFSKFSPGTKAQLELSEKVSTQIAGKGISEIWDVILLCLNRNEQWVSASKGVLSSLTYEIVNDFNSLAISCRLAYDEADRGNFREAVSLILSQSNKIDDNVLKGFVLQLLAEYLNFYDPVESQTVLLSASSFNRRVVKPLSGIGYHKINAVGVDQSIQCSNYLSSLGSNPNKIIVNLEGILSNVIFKPETANIFEESFKNIAFFLGFEAQRPENEYSSGPDLLWSLGNLQYFVIECKNGAISDSINKHDCNQLNGSTKWFERKYDNTCNYIPLLIHPSLRFEFAATPHSATRIIDRDSLIKFVEAIRGFIKSLCANNSYHNHEAIRQQLAHFKLRKEDFINAYTKACIVSR